MSDYKDKFSETFNMNEMDEATRREIVGIINQIEITEDPTLQEIAVMALESYKMQMMDIANIEPKFRSRALEVAQMFLTVAKDAVAKKNDNEFKHKKLDAELEDENEDENENTGSDKDAILMELDNYRGNKQKKTK